MASAILLGMVVFAAGCEKKQAAGPPPPPTVTVVKVTQEDVPVIGNWVATLDGYTNAQIQPQVSGYLVKQNYREGSLVRQGAILFEIDPRPFQAIVDQAKGQLAQAEGQVEQAKGQLAQARSQLALANINVKRDTPLAKQRAIAQSQLDNDVQGQAQAQAMVESNQANIVASQASVKAAQASVAQAELNLGFTRVRSLVDGIAGTAATQIGNLVNTSTILTTVSKVNPIKAYFPISEQEYMRVADKIKPGVNGDWLRNAANVPLQLSLGDGQVFSKKGKIVFADRQVDNQTGTIRIVGAFDNPGNILRPGQFGRVSAITDTRKNALLIPQKSISELQGNFQVAVVGDNNKVSIRKVIPGPRHESMWVIEKGLNLSDRVVSEGTSKVIDGMTVNPQPEAAQAASR